MGCGYSTGKSLKMPKMPSIFNYKLKGVWNKDARTNFDATIEYKKQNPAPSSSLQRLKAGRQMIEGFVAQAKNSEIYNKYPKDCQNENMEFDGTQFGSDNNAISVIVHTPLNILNQKATTHPCIVYGHGGGACMMSADDYDFIVCRTALDNGCVVVNVDYRLAPQAKAPKGINDYYAAIKWTISNSKKLGIDTSRICLMGDSGGGYITAGACVKLAQNNQQNLVKLYVPIVPMVSDYYFVTKPQNMNEVERNSCDQIKDCIGYLAEDLEKQKNDPYIFPNKMSDSIAKRFPKTVIFSSQFCFLRQSAEQLACILQRNGRLLDICIQPGCDHDFFANFESKSADTYFKDIKKALSKWLV